jgi:hypothetical protein
MSITVNVAWPAVSALCALIGLICGAAAFVIRAIVRDEVRKINGTYVRAQVFEVFREELDARLDTFRRAA